MQSRVDVGGTVRFIENSAVNGGGLALEDQCLVNMPYAMKLKLCNVIIIIHRTLQIHLLRNSAMYFYRNTAEVDGGAIYVRAPSVAIDSNILPIFNTRCFVEYEVVSEPFSLDPQEWKVANSLQQPILINIDSFLVVMAIRSELNL